MKDEKELDRIYNSGHLWFRKFNNKETCPTCNIPDLLKPIINSAWDEEKQTIVEFEREHDRDDCFRVLAGMDIAQTMAKKNQKLDLEKIDVLTEKALKTLKSLEKKFTEGKK